MMLSSPHIGLGCERQSLFRDSLAASGLALTPPTPSFPLLPSLPLYSLFDKQLEFEVVSNNIRINVRTLCFKNIYDYWI